MHGSRRIATLLGLSIVALAAVVAGAGWSMPHRSEAAGGPPEIHYAIEGGGTGCSGTSPNVVCMASVGVPFTVKVLGSSSTPVSGTDLEMFVGGLSYTPGMCMTEITMRPLVLCLGPNVGGGGQLYFESSTGGWPPPLPPWNNPPDLAALHNVTCSAAGTFKLVLTAHPYTHPGSHFRDTSASMVLLKTRTTATVDPDGPAGNPPLTVPVADTLTVVCVDVTVDTDSDGCTDVREEGMMAISGGQRNPLNFWDFFDVWTRVSIMGPWERNKAVGLPDIFFIAKRFAKTGNPNDDPLIAPADETSYHPDFDRTYVGPFMWNLGPPDGAIGLSEIFWAAQQYAHNCN